MVQRVWQIDNVSATAHRCYVLGGIRVGMARWRWLLGIGRVRAESNEAKRQHHQRNHRVMVADLVFFIGSDGMLRLIFFSFSD
jgi:hypothetical protein